MIDREWQQKHQEEREDMIDKRDKEWHAEQEKKNRKYTIVAGISGAVTGAIITAIVTWLVRGGR